MYDPILAKSFTRYDRRRFGFCAIALCFIIALTICSSFKPPLRPISLVGGAINLQLSINAVEDMLIADDTIASSDKTVGSSATPETSSSPAPAPGILTLNPTKVIIQPINLPSPNPEPKPVQSDQNKKIEPPCTVLKADADYCEIEGDIRINSTSSTIFLVRPRSTISHSNITSWTIQPYPRRGITYVRNWTVTLAPDYVENLPECSKSHTLPALLFSIGGYTGNHFHDFADLIIPLYSTSHRFKREVHFLASDYKPWWPAKFHAILDRLTKHGVADIDRETDVNCYSKLIAGLRFDKELIIDPSGNNNPSTGVSMFQFRQLIRETYSLERRKAKRGRRIRPRLMIISRKRTRIMTNEDEVSRVARKLGYEVVLAEGDSSTNLTKFASLVNSCDVMMGIHGAGLTNMVFLPDNAVLIQVVPWGAIDGFAKLDFGNPAPGMNIRYLEYKIEMRESSLIQDYPKDHPVLRDPLSFHRNGWGQLRAVYLDNQNVTIDIHRFKGTLAKALKLLRH